MANIEVVGLESTGAGTGQLRSARTGTDTYTVTGSMSATASNATVTLSPTGTGTVTIAPAGTGTAVSIAPTAGNVSIAPTAGSLTINPATTGSLDNVTIGATTQSTGKFTTVTATSTTGVVLDTNASYVRGKTSSGTATRMLGINSANTCYIGSVDAAITSFNFNNGGTAHLTIDSSGNVTVPVSGAGLGIGTTGVSTASLSLQGGTATRAPISLASGTNLTTPAAGAVEYDGKVGYFTPTANSSGTAARGLLPVQYFTMLNYPNIFSAYTANSVQNIFGVSGATGALTLPPTATTTTYVFDCFFELSGLLSTSQSVSFGIGGTATLTNFMWSGVGGKSANSNAPVSNVLSNVTIGASGAFTFNTLPAALAANTPITITGTNTGTGSVTNGTYYVMSTPAPSTTGFSLTATPGGATAITTTAGTSVGLTYMVGTYTGSTVINLTFATGAATGTLSSCVIKGMLTVGTGGGTIIPQFSYTGTGGTSPSPAVTVVPGSYFSMTPIGSTNNSVGPWT